MRVQSPVNLLLKGTLLNSEQRTSPSMPGRRAFALTKLLLCISGLASAVATVTIIAFFSVGQPWGTFNDFAYGIMTLAMLPVVVAIRRGLGRQASGASVWIVGLVSLPGYSAVSFLEVAQEVGLLSLRSLEPIPGLGPLALGVVFFALFEVWLLMLGALLK